METVGEFRHLKHGSGLGPCTKAIGKGGRGEGRLFTREGSFRDACSVLAEGQKGEGEVCGSAADWLPGPSQ